MRNPNDILINLRKHSNESTYQYLRLYRNLFNEQMFYAAYQRIYAKPGNMTSSTDGRTIDQMTLQRIDDIIKTLKDESYKPKPVRRVYIPKKNGKLRPLGVPTFDDKLVQEVIRMILESIYENYFEESSHGFRPYRSCHTALKHIFCEFTGTKWFIEGDIKGFFDNIDHNVLIEILNQRIADERFLRLIRKFLNAGYLEQWTYHNTYSGTPQGGIISPILANIYLDTFDRYIAECAQAFDKGVKRKYVHDYKLLNRRLSYIRKKVYAEDDEEKRKTLIAEHQLLRKELLSMPSGDPMDDTYKRLKYVRYADDFLIGVAGSKADCEKIKADITQFMSEKLRLELSAEKTLITNAQDKAKFLGYEIYVRKSDALKRNNKGVLRRSHNARVVLELPKEAVKKKLLEYGAMVIKDNGTPSGEWRSNPRRKLINQKPEEILALINGEIRGFYNYYSIAHNIGNEGAKFGHFMKYSFFKTLALKYRSSVSKINIKYRRGKEFVIPYKDDRGKDKFVILYNEGFKKKTASDYARIDSFPLEEINVPYPTLAERLMEKTCELCGKEDTELVMHHVRKLAQLKGEVKWEEMMLKRRRKTLAVCPQCMQSIIDYNK